MSLVLSEANHFTTTSRALSNLSYDASLATFEFRQSEERHAAYDDDENDAKYNKDERGVCWDWNTRKCDYYNCKYDHRCAECGGLYPKKNCAIGDNIMNMAKAAADDPAPCDD
jgi:hypothetical protein